MAIPTAALSDLGVSIWLDDLSRDRLATGSLADLMTTHHVVGVTSNPTIFAQALAGSSGYDADIRAMKQAGKTAEEAVFDIMITDVQGACDLLNPVFEASRGQDGRVSLEVSPLLARDTAGTIAQAKDLWRRVDRPNLMIKIPATRAGLPAISEVIASGISVNVTLIFSLSRYAEVIDAYQAGIERCSNPKQVHSVASFFVSRLDSAIDKLLTDENLKGKAAIANARLAYELYLEKFKDFPHNHQRPLWASTGVKDPAYRPTLYVDTLIAANTVNTMPPATLAAVQDSDFEIRDSIKSNIESAKSELLALAEAGIDLNQITNELEADGVMKFMASWETLLAEVEKVKK